MARPPFVLGFLGISARIYNCTVVCQYHGFHYLNFLATDYQSDFINPFGLSYWAMILGGISPFWRGKSFLGCIPNIFNFAGRLLIYPAL
jgi:hypothetical protein